MAIECVPNALMVWAIRAVDERIVHISSIRQPALLADACAPAARTSGSAEG
jgi:hypothetical protein